MPIYRYRLLGAVACGKGVPRTMQLHGQTVGPELDEVIDEVGRGIDFISTEDDFANLNSSSLDLLNNVRRFAAP